MKCLGIHVAKSITLRLSGCHICFRGVIIASLNASLNPPTTPPCRTPNLSFLPNKASLNVSDEASIPSPAPTAAFPSKPKGPPNSVDMAPIAAPRLPATACSANHFLFFSSMPNPPSSLFLNSSLDFKKPKPAPKNNPATGPNGIIILETIPSIPDLAIVGKCFCTASTIPAEIRPLSSLLPLTSLPNKASRRDWDSINKSVPNCIAGDNIAPHGPNVR